MFSEASVCVSIYMIILEYLHAAFLACILGFIIARTSSNLKTICSTLYMFGIQLAQDCRVLKVKTSR